MPPSSFRHQRNAGSGLGLVDWLTAWMTRMAVLFQSLMTSARPGGLKVGQAAARLAAMTERVTDKGRGAILVLIDHLSFRLKMVAGGTMR